jgi:hypothetical protein
MEMTGSRFDPDPAPDLGPPKLVPVTLPDFEGAFAIWGATGRDHRGHVWVGVSANGGDPPSAHLFEYAPETGQVTDRGDAVSQLKRGWRHRRGEGQMKIHSRIVQADDGYLYFATMDEEGEATDGSRLPIWGSHLWRVRPEGGDWEHLLAVPEALIAVSGVGRLVYALGYFDHALYQYDTATGKVRSTRVGAAGGHISRNFLADERGHAYVPRLRPLPSDPARLTTTLVEYDDELREMAETPIHHYTQTRNDESHGIVGILYLADHTMVFATDQGHLYKITPRSYGPSRVESLGDFHPEGEAYVPSLFSFDGRSEIVGVSQRLVKNPTGPQWLVFDLQSGLSRASPLELPQLAGRPPVNLLLYGSITRDNAGQFYLGGAHAVGDRFRPVLIQARPPTLKLRRARDDRTSGREGREQPLSKERVVPQ